MAFHNHSYPDNRSHQALNETPFNPLPSHHWPISAAQPVAATAFQNANRTHMTPPFNPMSRGNLPQSSQSAVAAYSRLVTGELLQRPMSAINTTEREEFTGSVTVMIPALLVLVVIGINGETIGRIREESGVIRIHIHKAPETDDFSVTGSARKCEIWGVEEKAKAAKRAIEDIIRLNRMSSFDILDTVFSQRWSSALTSPAT